MLLTRVKIKGYRSIREEIEIVFDKHVTVVLGPNDHGKTNVLNALLHLNEDRQYEADDLNWDCPEESGARPSVYATFQLTDAERMSLIDTENRVRDEFNSRIGSQGVLIDPGRLHDKS